MGRTFRGSVTLDVPVVSPIPTELKALVRSPWATALFSPLLLIQVVSVSTSALDGPATPWCASPLFDASPSLAGSGVGCGGGEGGGGGGGGAGGAEGDAGSGGDDGGDGGDGGGDVGEACDGGDDATGVGGDGGDIGGDEGGVGGGEVGGDGGGGDGGGVGGGTGGGGISGGSDNPRIAAWAARMSIIRSGVMPRLPAITTAIAGGAASRAERTTSSVTPMAAATARVEVGMAGWARACPEGASVTAVDGGAGVASSWPVSPGASVSGGDSCAGCIEGAVVEGAVVEGAVAEGVCGVPSGPTSHSSRQRRWRLKWGVGARGVSSLPGSACMC